MNGSAVNPQQLQGLPVSRNGPVMYGSGIVFGGNVYPVLIDGVPIQPPAGAHQAAVQQRLQMQSMQQSAGDHQTAMQPQMQMPRRLQEAHTQQTSCKPLSPQRSYQRSEAPVPSHKPRTFARAPGNAAPEMTKQQQQQQHRQLQLRQPQLPPMGGSYRQFNFNFNNNNPQPNAGGDFFGNWDGYCMWQPTDLNKPYAIGWI